MSAFLTIVLVIVAIVAWLALGVASLACWDTYGRPKRRHIIGRWALPPVLLLSLAYGVYLALRAADTEDQACRDRGGEMVKVGEHYVSTGKTLVLVPEYECGLRTERVGS